MSRRHPDEGYEEYPWRGDVVVQWEETGPEGPEVRERVVWTTEPRWDAPGYSSEDAENEARRDAAHWLADALAQLGQPARGRRLAAVADAPAHPLPEDAERDTTHRHRFSRLRR